MSDYREEDRSPSSQHQQEQQQQLGNVTPLHNVSFEEAAANNSIIGKVKSRVSSIFPNRLSKWFSPSTKTPNESLNGSITNNTARRRRRIEVEDDEEEEDEELDVENNTRVHGEYLQNRGRTKENYADEDLSQNSEEEDEGDVGIIMHRSKQKQHDFGRQPPAKRSRFAEDLRDSPMSSRRHSPLVASTPAVTSSIPSRPSYQRFTNSNVYENQTKREPAFNFATESTVPKLGSDIINLISNSSESDNKTTDDNQYASRPGISSRRSLNIASTANNHYTTLQLKRQSLATVKTHETAAGSHVVGCTPARRTSTTIHEVLDFENEQQQREDSESAQNGNTLHTVSSHYMSAASKGNRAYVNGSEFNAIEEADQEAEVIIDSASESGDSAVADALKTNQQQEQQKKAGLFNIIASPGQSRNSSRTSSFSNGLNFYSHLEGKKSLFSGGANSRSSMQHHLNNSTLSLTSLNRRQFNASIYGSTSALSDSRLLNTFSPFYKGKTTYGGAAAYNKYTAGAGASAIRITPTLIRPTSSLSTLSSSNNSLATNATASHHHHHHHGGADSSSISSTAKRILNLINDFATPLSEAKKMASSIKVNSNSSIMHTQAKGRRLNDTDLSAARAIRLSQLRSPYSRPAVILQPSGGSGGPLPPVRDLQVPSMSQLVQMKKIQNVTEKSRNTAASVTTAEYTLPAAAVDSSLSNSTAGAEAATGVRQQHQHHPAPPQERHTNKIKNKISTAIRSSAASKDLHDEAAPSPANLPNIAFPLMHCVPKIDIKLTSSSASSSTTTTTTTKPANSTDLKSSLFTATEQQKNIGSFKQIENPSIINNFAFNAAPSAGTTMVAKPASSSSSSNILDCSKSIEIKSTANSFIPLATAKVNFKFSEPFEVSEVPITPQNITSINVNNYKFSPPLDIQIVEMTNTTASLSSKQSEKSQLKTTGSCLDALSKPISTQPLTPPNPPLNLFGEQFKKSSDEWECTTCMIRNKSAVNKCVACETSRKQAATTVGFVSQPPTTKPLQNSSLSDQFKKSSDEWDCETCMIRNKGATTKCVACETPKNNVQNATIAKSATFTNNSFGDAFKPKSGTWECQTCLITNKNDVNECIACQTRKPGSVANAVPATTFKFGFGAATSVPKTTDDGFKSLAAQQKASKWECDACMTRNDAARSKCACCEQPKPGSTNSGSSGDSSTNKFSFGATAAAAKFSFGFGSSTNVIEKEELKQKNVEPIKKTDGEKTSGFTFGAAAAPATTTSFSFGVKPNSTPLPKDKPDQTDSNKLQGSSASATSFKFGTQSKAEEETAKKKPDLSTASNTFAFGIKPTESATASTLKAKDDDETTKKTVLPSATSTFAFGLKQTSTLEKDNKPNATDSDKLQKPPSVISNTSTTSFKFGTQPKEQEETKKKPELSSAAGTFAFGINKPAALETPTQAKQITTVQENHKINSFTTSAGSTTNSFTSSFGGFSSSNKNTATATTSTATLFGSVTSTTATAPNTTVTSTSSASTNIFGSFGGNTNTIKPFSSNTITPANPIVSSSTSNSSKIPQFGTFETQSSPASTFGSFASGNALETQKSSIPTFGSVASSTSAAPSGGFVFGSTSKTSTTTATTTTATTKNSFVFGSAATSTTTAAAATASDSVTKPSVFGSFGAISGNGSGAQQQATSIFGSSSATQQPSTFGSGNASSASNPSTNLFSTNSTPAAASNIFGSASSGSATTPAPAFGSSPFSGGNAATNATPTFGSTAALGISTTNTTFGGFASTAATSANSTNPPETKKPETAFNFGGSNTSTAQNLSGGFNFGSGTTSSTLNAGGQAATKPAFNFSATATPQPSFNFTGGTSATESQNVAKPFQFGATPSAAPIFNFSSGALEATPNAPFQFNAGTAPAATNIFAPQPPVPGAQAAQQARRKIRAPIRRLTPR